MFASARTFARAVHVASPRPRSSSTTTTTTRAAAGDVWMPGSARPKYLDGTAPGCVRANERTRARRYRDASSVCVFFLNRDSSVSTRERVWIRSDDARSGSGIGWSGGCLVRLGCSIAPDRIGSKTDDDAWTNTRRIDDGDAGGRATGVRVRRSSRPVTRTNERTNGWMDGCALEDTRR